MALRRRKQIQIDANAPDTKQCWVVSAGHTEVAAYLIIPDKWNIELFPWNFPAVNAQLH